MGARDGAAQRHRVQGVGGDGTLDALHGDLEEGCTGEWWNKQREEEMLIYCMQNRQQWNNHVRRELRT